MKINELKKIAEENNYEYKKNDCQHKLISMLTGNFIIISNKFEKKLWVKNMGYCDDKDFDILKASVEFAETPIEDREEETRFYLEHKYFRFDNGSRKYLGMDLIKNEPDLYPKITYRWVKNQFTEKEIDEIKEKFNTDLADFEIIEVEDDCKTLL